MKDVVAKQQNHRLHGPHAPGQEVLLSGRPASWRVWVVETIGLRLCHILGDVVGKTTICAILHVAVGVPQEEDGGRIWHHPAILILAATVGVAEVTAASMGVLGQRGRETLAAALVVQQRAHPTEICMTTMDLVLRDRLVELWLERLVRQVGSDEALRDEGVGATLCPEQHVGVDGASLLELLSLHQLQQPAEATASMAPKEIDFEVPEPFLVVVHSLPGAVRR